jgi:hypothetical protein
VEPPERERHGQREERHERGRRPESPGNRAVVGCEDAVRTARGEVTPASASDGAALGTGMSGGPSPWGLTDHGHKKGAARFLADVGPVI